MSRTKEETESAEDVIERLDKLDYSFSLEEYTKEQILSACSSRANKEMPIKNAKTLDLIIKSLVNAECEFETICKTINTLINIKDSIRQEIRTDPIVTLRYTNLSDWPTPNIYQPNWYGIQSSNIAVYTGPLSRAPNNARLHQDYQHALRNTTIFVDIPYYPHIAYYSRNLIAELILDNTLRKGIATTASNDVMHEICQPNIEFKLPHHIINKVVKITAANLDRNTEPDTLYIRAITKLLNKDTNIEESIKNAIIFAKNSNINTYKQNEHWNTLNSLKQDLPELLTIIHMQNPELATQIYIFDGFRNNDQSLTREILEYILFEGHNISTEIATQILNEKKELASKIISSSINKVSSVQDFLAKANILRYSESDCFDKNIARNLLIKICTQGRNWEPSSLWYEKEDQILNAVKSLLDQTTLSNDDTINIFSNMGIEKNARDCDSLLSFKIKALILDKVNPTSTTYVEAPRPTIEELVLEEMRKSRKEISQSNEVTLAKYLNRLNESDTTAIRRYTDQELNDLIINPLLEGISWNKFSEVFLDHAKVNNHPLSIKIYKTAIHELTKIPLDIISAFPDEKIMNIANNVFIKRNLLLQQKNLETLTGPDAEDFPYIKKFRSRGANELRNMLSDSGFVALQAVATTFQNSNQDEKNKILNAIKIKGEQILHSRKVYSPVNPSKLVEMFSKPEIITKLSEAYSLWDQGGVKNIIKASIIALSLAIHSQTARSLWAIVVYETLTPKKRRLQAIGQSISEMCKTDNERGVNNLESLLNKPNNNPYVTHAVNYKLLNNLQFNSNDLSNKVIDGYSCKNISFNGQASLTRSIIMNCDFSNALWGITPDLHAINIDVKSLSTMKSLPDDTITTDATLTDLNIEKAILLQKKTFEEIIINSLCKLVDDRLLSTKLFRMLKNICTDDDLTKKYFKIVANISAEELRSITETANENADTLKTLLDRPVTPNKHHFSWTERVNETRALRATGFLETKGGPV